MKMNLATQWSKNNEKTKLSLTHLLSLEKMQRSFMKEWKTKKTHFASKNSSFRENPDGPTFLLFELTLVLHQSVSTCTSSCCSTLFCRNRRFSLSVPTVLQWWNQFFNYYYLFPYLVKRGKNIKTNLATSITAHHEW